MSNPFSRASLRNMFRGLVTGPSAPDIEVPRPALIETASQGPLEVGEFIGRLRDLHHEIDLVTPLPPPIRSEAANAIVSDDLPESSLPMPLDVAIGLGFTAWGHATMPPGSPYPAGSMSASAALDEMLEDEQCGNPRPVVRMPVAADFMRCGRYEPYGFLCDEPLTMNCAWTWWSSLHNRYISLENGQVCWKSKYPLLRFSDRHSANNFVPVLAESAGGILVQVEYSTYGLQFYSAVSGNQYNLSSVSSLGLSYIARWVCDGDVPRADDRAIMQFPDVENLNQILDIFNRCVVQHFYATSNRRITITPHEIMRACHFSSKFYVSVSELSAPDNETVREQRQIILD